MSTSVDDMWRWPPQPVRRDSPHPALSAISARLCIGEYPRPEDLAWLATQHHITAVVSLQDDDDLVAKGIDLEALRSAASACGILFHRFPVADCNPASLSAQLGPILRTLALLDAAGHVIYVHCNAGLNRAPTVAIAHLHARGGLDLERACALVKSRRACGPYMQLLHAYFGD